jgi:hypothetical protein
MPWEKLLAWATGQIDEALRQKLEFVLEENRVYRTLYMANSHSSGDWRFKQPAAMTLPTVILKAGCLRGWAARFLSGRVAG